MPWPGTPALPHLRLSWGGTLGTPAVDIWSNALAFRINDGTAASAEELQPIAEDTTEYLSELVSFAQNQVSPAVKHTWTKAVWILNTGKQRDQNTAIYDLPVPVQGGGSAVIWEQSYAATFRTALKRGRGHAGRIYLPVCGPMPEGTTPYAPATFANNLATNVAGAINGVNSVINTVLGGQGPRSADPVVVSRGTEQNPIPLLTEITRVVVDRVADIQHRRVNRVPRLEGNSVPV